MFKRLYTFTAAALLTVAGYVAAADGAAQHPSSYTVQRGDTLWSIAAKFLDKPWRWPEIWQANPQIENPHRLYPGDVISLAYLDGKPVAQVAAGPRSEGPVGAVPLAEIEPFLKQLSVVDNADSLPYVVALEGERLRSGPGQMVYVRGLSGMKVGDMVSVQRPMQQYRAGDRRLHTQHGDMNFRGDHSFGRWTDRLDSGGDVLGTELMQQNSGQITQFKGELALVVLTDADREVRVGDRVQALAPTVYDDQFFPSPPARVAEGARVLAVADGMLTAGPHSVIALSVGSADGVKNGTVFSLWAPGAKTPDTVATNNRIDGAFNSVQLPDEYNGHAMVFRTFNRVSYALVMEGIRPVTVGDVLKHPDATQ
jgi:nucleoid-associated protein YgaU